MKSSREVNGEIYIFKVKGVHTSSQSQTQLYLNLFSSCICQNTRNWTRFLPVVHYSSDWKVKAHHGLHNHHAWLASLLLLLSQNTENMGHEEIIAVVREAHTARARWRCLEKADGPCWQSPSPHAVIQRPAVVSTGSPHSGRCPLTSLRWPALSSTFFWIQIHHLNIISCQSLILSMPWSPVALSHQRHQSMA